MPLKDEFLTQDIDVLPGNEPMGNESSITDILPDAAKVEAEVKKEEGTDMSTEGEAEGTLDPELEALLNTVNESSGQVTEELGTAGDKIEEAKGKIEAIQENPEAINTDDLLKEIYEDLLQTETSLQASRIAEDVARSKVSELQAQISNLEIDAAGQYQTDNPDLMIINKLIDAAQGGSDVALPKVKNALNKLYLGLFNSTIEEGQVKNNLDNIDESGITLNESTLPKGENKAPEEPVDINDITSILG